VNYQSINSFEEPARIIRRAGVPEETVMPATIGESIRLSFRRRFSAEGFRRFRADNIPCKGDGAKEVVRKIIRAVAFLLIVAGLAYYVYYYHNYRKQAELYGGFIDIINEYVNVPEAKQDKAWSDIREKYPTVEFPEGMNIKYAPMYAVNQDMVGWLRIPNTNISTALLQSADSEDYYLYKNFYKESSRYGNPFVDSNCRFGKDGTSKNVIIYGHNTHDGLMFHQLTNYMTVEGYKKAPVIQLDTLYDSSQWKIFAVMLTNSTSDMNNGEVFTYLYPDFSSNESFMALVKEMYARSMIHTGVDVQPDDTILTLYTCYQNIFRGGRLVVFARKVRDGESPTVDTSAAYYDSSAIFPQAYYDAMGY
jgi:SrtB family sortase